MKMKKIQQSQHQFLTFFQLSFIIMITLQVLIVTNNQNKLSFSIFNLYYQLQLAKLIKGMQDLFESYTIKNTQLKCEQSNLIQRLCINPQCEQYSLHCQHSNCRCLIKNHQMCYSILMFIIRKKIQKIINNQKNYLVKTFQIEDKLIEQLRQARKQLIQKVIFGDLQDKYKDMITDMFYKGNTATFKGKEANDLYVRLKQSKIYQIWNVESQEFQIYENRSKLIMNQLTNLKKKVLYKESEIKQQNEANAMINQSISATLQYSIPFLNSKILSIDDPEGLQKIKYIYQQLGKPKSLELLFRASEHQFRAQNFHKKCDNIQNTFTLIRTQFQKTIGAFTPIKWNKDLNNWAIDQAMSSFLLQLQMKQKMKLIRCEAAIYNNDMFGPTFGGGFDLFISDKCNENNLSSCKFPYSYNNQTPYPLTDDARLLLCGGSYFKIIQYEIFKVIFAQPIPQK